MPELRSITPDDISQIKAWPSYGDGFEQMDYALREKGWLDEFRGKPNTWIYASVFLERLIGFCLLSKTSEREAEFRIALHRDWLGRGFGRAITLAAVDKGFRELNLCTISLIVRKNNPRASRLYERVGFLPIGESIHRIHGQDIAFIDMVMTSMEYGRPLGKENL
ncbi:MAG: GNAT family N-acetyltransferase [Nitrospirota bacterium]|nr:GNAT family N-acetyltransferase [Nitrospirota bacterium]